MSAAYPLQINFLIHWHHVILFVDSYLYYGFSAVEASSTMAPSFCNKNCPMFLLHIRSTSWFDQVIPHQFTSIHHFLMGSSSIHHPPYHLGRGFLDPPISTSGATQALNNAQSHGRQHTPWVPALVAGAWLVDCQQIRFFSGKSQINAG